MKEGGRCKRNKFYASGDTRRDKEKERFIHQNFKGVKVTKLKKFRGRIFLSQAEHVMLSGAEKTRIIKKCLHNKILSPLLIFLFCFGRLRTVIF